MAGWCSRAPRTSSATTNPFARSGWRCKQAPAHRSGGRLKAAICYEFDKPVRVEDVVLDAPRRNEVRVRIAACGVCHSDLSVIRGVLRSKLPCVLGHEGAGIVEEVGEAVTHVARGDKVVLAWVTSCSTCFYCRIGKPQLCEV